MLKGISLVVCVISLICALSGCGGAGGGAGSMRDPNGTFTFGMTPSADFETGIQLAMEIEAEGGVITSGFARFVSVNYSGETTANVTGNASLGNIEASAVFKTFEVDVNAVFTGVSWHGTYIVRSGLTILEEGDLTITKTGTSTPNISGDWNGVIDYGKGTLPVELTIDQTGHQFEITGTISAASVSGDGSIIGRSCQITLIAVVDGDIIRFLATVNSDLDDMDGGGVGFTVSLQKVVP